MAVPPGICSRLVKAKNVRFARADLTQVNIARCDIRVVPTTHRPLPLLSCDRTEAEECEHYSYSYCHDRFRREFHVIMCFVATP